MKRSRVLLGVLGAGAAVLATVAPVSVQAGQPHRTVFVASSSRALPNTGFVRTRDCIRRPATCVNGASGLELVYLVKGRMPRGRTAAVVLTDASCTPDAQGISHCMNILRLASGQQITIRHDHSMMNDPCLSPGEHVRVRVLTQPG